MQGHFPAVLLSRFMSFCPISPRPLQTTAAGELRRHPARPARGRQPAARGSPAAAARTRTATPSATGAGERSPSGAAVHPPALVVGVPGTHPDAAGPHLGGRAVRCPPHRPPAHVGGHYIHPPDLEREHPRPGALHPKRVYFGLVGAAVRLPPHRRHGGGHLADGLSAVFGGVPTGVLSKAWQREKGAAPSGAAPFFSSALTGQLHQHRPEPVGQGALHRHPAAIGGVEEGEPFGV